MPLKDAHIVIDGYNLVRRQGTGIKTYGLTLARTLAGLGARVSILWGGGGPRIPVVREAMLHDRPPKGPFPLSRALRLAAFHTPLFTAARPAGHVPTGLVIPDQKEDDLAPLAHRFYALPDCYIAAHRLFQVTGIPYRVRFPDRVDAWHATCPLPVHARGTRNVTTIHDLIPLRLPWATLDNRPLFYRTVRRALLASDLVLAVSEHTRKDIVEVFGVPPERIIVTYEPCIFPSGPPAAEQQALVLGTYGLKPGDYALFVGAIEPKKNVGRLLAAWRASNADIPLVVAGGKGWLSKEQLKLSEPLVQAGRLMLASYVPRAHLPHLYAGARFFVFPSLYEGFGLPPLEAMAHGCPVLTSNVASLPEICGDAALYCDPTNLDDLTDKLKVMLGADALRQQLVAKGRERVAAFSPEAYARRLAAAYAAIL